MMGKPKPPITMANIIGRTTSPHSPELERVLLTELGLPNEVSRMKLGQVQYLRDCIIPQISFPLQQNTIEIIQERKYLWRDEPVLKSTSPIFSLYLDSLVRLNEIYDAFKVHESAESFPKSRAILGRIS